MVVVVNVDFISAKSLQSKLTELQKCRTAAAEGFDLGSLMRVRGNVTTYNGQREVKASQFGWSLIVCCCFITTIVTSSAATHSNLAPCPVAGCCHLANLMT